jgi:predicted enzyme related to lactoylglutathione lyase
MPEISVRFITDNITPLVRFYERTLEIKANWATPDFAEIVTSVATLAIGSTKTLALFGTGVAVPKANKSAILEFRVTDVDKDYARAKEFISEIVQDLRQCRGVIAHFCSETPMAIWGSGSV